MIRTPLVWACLSYIVGLMIGRMSPQPWYVFGALAVLFLTTVARHARGRWYEVAVLVTWLFVGAARINLQIDWESFFAPLRRAAEGYNESLIGQLRQEGLKGEALGLVSSIVLGNKVWLDSATRSAFRMVGGSHLLALSGMHLGILYGLMYAIIVRWVRYTSWRWFSYPPLLLLIWGYAWLTGFSPSLVRASMMLTVIMGFTLSSRFYALVSDPSRISARLHILALSALLMLWIDPMNLYDIGFQLSYIAVLSLVVFDTSRNQSPSRKWGRVVNWGVDVVLVSFVAQLGTLPLSAYYFHVVPLTGILINILLIPLTMLIIYVSLPLLIFPCALGVSVLSKVVGFTCKLVTWWSTLPGITVDSIYPPAWGVVLFYLFLLLVAIRRGSEPVSIRREVGQ